VTDRYADDRDGRDSRGRSGSRRPARGPVTRGRRGGPSSDLPWPLATGGALLVTALAGAIGLHRTGVVGGIFPFAFVVSCVAAALLVRRSQMLVPAVEPPIVMTLAIALVWLVLQGGGGVGAFLLGVLGPLAEMFWWILVATVATLGVTVARSRGILDR